MTDPRWTHDDARQAALEGWWLVMGDGGVRVELTRATITQAWAEYERVNAQAQAEYERVRGQAYAEYERATDQAWAEYTRATDQAWAEYERVTGALLDATLTRIGALADEGSPMHEKALRIVAASQLGVSAEHLVEARDA
jgi:cell division septum initiation protein DivIVA